MALPEDTAAEYALFGERGARVVVSVSPEKLAAVRTTARQYGVGAHEIGKVTSDNALRIEYKGHAVVSAPVPALKDAWAHAARAQFEDPMTNKLAYADDRFHDECGVFGVFGHPEAANLTYLGLYALQHRGQESAGIVASTGRDLNLHRAMGEVEEIFQPSVLAKLPGSSAIGHTRYSTAGDKALLNAQPIMIDCNKGKIAVGT